MNRKTNTLELRKNNTSCQIIIIDDEENIRSAVKLILEDEGFHVIEAEDGVAGLAAIMKSETPSIVLLDILMPRMTGNTVIRELANNPKILQKHAYIVITATLRRIEPDVVKLMKQFNIHAMQKPLEVIKLLSMIQICLEQLY